MGITDAGVYLADTDQERLWTSATVVTFVRTIASGAICAAGVIQESLTLLVIALAVYWVGDMADGAVARYWNCETRIGATMDIISDRFNSCAFYFSLAVLEPTLTIPIFIYVFNFVVIDGYLSLAFLAWPIKSPNYFYVIDRSIYAWNWSPIGKASNSGIFAVLLLVTGNMWLGIAIACALVALKLWSLGKLMRLGVPVPTVSHERPL